MKKINEKTTKIIPARKRPIKNADKTFRRLFFASTFALGIVSFASTTHYCLNEPVKISIEGMPNKNKPNNHNADPELLNLSKNELNRRLIRAAFAGNVEQVELLLDSGADIDTRNSFEWTPLILSAGNIYSDETAKFLISRGADVNAKNNFGITPLMIAAGSGRISIVKCLIEYGADIHAEDYKGETAFDKAIEMEFKKTADIIADYEAKNK